MNRLDRKLAERRPLLACYLPVGDPLIPVEFIEVYIACGVDILELGMPSHDPYLDGDDVSASMARAIAAGDAIDALSDACVFSVFRHAAQAPAYRIEKRPALARRQGAWAVIGEGGMVLKRAHELDQVLTVFESRKFRVVE